jgi:hypothetical protein
LIYLSADWRSVERPLRCKVVVFLLDTNVVSELRKVRPHGAVVAWLEGVADAELYLSAVTLGEIQAGIEITREQDTAKAADIEAWADSGGGYLQCVAHGRCDLSAMGEIDAPSVGHSL